MSLKNQIIASLLIFSFASQVWAFDLLDQNKNLKGYARDQYNKGYKEYLIDYWVPGVGVLEQIPNKRPNPKLKEKFKG